MQIEKDSAGVKFPPPFAFAGTLLLGLALDRLIGEPGIPLGHSFHRTFGMLAVVMGAGVTLTAMGLFRRTGTAPEPWKPSSALVTDGVYRWSRNPMYFGMALTYAGAALLMDSLAALLLLIPLVFVIQREVIEREEAYMASKFGDRYRAYRGEVRRWI